MVFIHLCTYIECNIKNTTYLLIPPMLIKQLKEEPTSKEQTISATLHIQEVPVKIFINRF